jgi:hypothetical protein
MKIRSLDELNTALSNDLSWRKKELSQLKYLVDRKDISAINKKYLLRSGITIIYAHWEGFIKVSAEFYLRFIDSKKVRNSELSRNLLTVSLCSSQNIFDGTSKYSYYSSIVDFFFECLAKEATIPHKRIIKTKSNLSSNVFKEIVWCLNLSYDDFEIKEKIIDYKLLDKRNKIAHGNYLDVDKDDVIFLRDFVIDLLVKFKNEIEDAAVSESFRR